MEVTFLDHTNTHAIIGGAAPESFGTEDNAEFYEMLSSTMYPNKKLAVVREVLCNAWDAHLMVGKVDVCVEITITDKEMSIKDFGPGIERTKIVGIYCRYGKSSKTHDGRQTGGFGLGSKAPFAYSKHFTVVSCHENKRTIYAASRGSAETNGKPDFRAMALDIPTDESGITVTIPVVNSEDARAFTTLATELAYLGGMKVKLNGKLLPTLDYEAGNFPFLVVGKERIGKHHGTRCGIYVRYGAVVYPVDESVPEIASALSSAHFLRVLKDNFAVILKAAPDSVGVAPSRESLSYTPKTITAIVELIAASETAISADRERLCATGRSIIQKAARSYWNNPMSRFQSLIERVEIVDLIKMTMNSPDRNFEKAMTEDQILALVAEKTLTRDSKPAVRKLMNDMDFDQIRAVMIADTRKDGAPWKRYMNQMEAGRRLRKRSTYDEKHSAGDTSFAYENMHQLDRIEKNVGDAYQVRFAFGHFSYDAFVEDGTNAVGEKLTGFDKNLVKPGQAPKAMSAIFAPSRAAATRFCADRNNKHRKEIVSKPVMIILTKKASDVDGAKAILTRYGFTVHDASAHVVKRDAIVPSAQLYLMGGTKQKSRSKRPFGPHMPDRKFDPETSTAKFYTYGKIDRESLEHEAEANAFMGKELFDWTVKNLGDVVIVQNAADARVVTKLGLRSVEEELAERLVALSKTDAGAALLFTKTSLFEGLAKIQEYFDDKALRERLLANICVGFECPVVDLENATGDQKALTAILAEYHNAYGTDGAAKFGVKHIVAAVATARDNVRSRYQKIIEVLESETFAEVRRCFQSYYYATRMNSVVLFAMLTAAVESIAAQLSLKSKLTDKELKNVQ